VEIIVEVGSEEDKAKIKEEITLIYGFLDEYETSNNNCRKFR
jgi:hypothetical protein